MYVSAEKYVRFVLLPSTLFTLIYFLLLLTILRSLFVSLGLFAILLYMIPMFILLTALLYPRIVKGKIRREIEDNIHFYITHLGALATAEVSRKEMMKMLSERKEYKALAEETKKIYLLMEKWNKNLAQACRFLAKRTPSKILADFLDRMAHELDSGEDFREFIKRAVDMGLHEKCYILAGVTPMKSVGMALYMAQQVPGMDVPDTLIKRLRGAGKGKVAEEGIKFALEQIEEFKEMEGVAGVHLMAIEWEHKVPEIAERAGMLPRPTV